MPEEKLSQVAFIAPMSADGNVSEIVINTGSNDGVKIDDRYLIFGLGEEIFDPASKRSLGKLEIVRGRGIVSHLQPNMATLQATSSTQRSERRKITKTTGGIGMFPFPTVTEEIEPLGKEFVGVQIGDFARKI